MEPTTKTPTKPAEQNPSHGGSYVREADGSLSLTERTKPAREQRATEPKTTGDAGTQE